MLTKRLLRASIPTLLLLTTLGSTLGQQSYAPGPSCPSLPFDDRIRLDCYPEQDYTKAKCLARGCCWLPGQSGDPDVPNCFFPDNYGPTFELQGIKWSQSGFNATLFKPTKVNGADDDNDEFNQVNLEARFETPSRLRLRVTIPSQPDRWEPPIELGEPDSPRPTADQVDYALNLTVKPFGITVFRKDDPNDVLLDSTGPLASAFSIADQFLQMAFKLNVQRAFGPGEANLEFPNDFSRWSRIGLWARDQVPRGSANLYDVHDLLIGLDHKGKAFGLFFLNSNAQEVVFTPLPSIAYRTNGGILDFFLFTGPTPNDVVAQYTQLIGRPIVPPYWSLGFHLSRHGYTNLNDLSTTLERNLLADIPIDAQWVDIDYMDAAKVWTINEKLFGDIGNFTKQTLHEKLGIRLVPVLDPGISIPTGSNYQPYEDGMNMGLFINYSSAGSPLIGKSWPGNSVFPDFSHPAAEDWWYRQAKQLYSRLPFDGLWLDMNTPSNFVNGSIYGCPASKYNKPRFVPTIPDKSLVTKTICPTARHHDTLHYNRHNLYAYDEIKVTHNVLKRLFPSQRNFVLSKSTFAGSGKYASHWTGDNLASWSDLKASVIDILAANMVGIPLVGADICGFRGQPNEELCIRWFQLGAFYPFSRSHNAIGMVPQDPAAWGGKAAAIIGKALKWRYRMLPYLYTQFFKAHLDGLPVLRPLAFEFPTDYSTHKINEQFMIGPSLMINPVLGEYQRHVDAYLPAAEWIDMLHLDRIVSSGQLLRLEAPIEKLPVLGRAGSILPVQFDLKRTSVSRRQGLNLYALLSSIDNGTTKDSPVEASGELYWDDGLTDPINYLHVDFRLANRTLTTSPRLSNPDKPPVFVDNEGKLRSLALFGVAVKPSSVMIDNNKSLDFHFDPDHEMVAVNFADPLDLMQSHKIKWTFD